MLCFYAIILGLLFLAEMVCGALAFAFLEKVHEGIGNELSTTIVHYRDPVNPTYSCSLKPHKLNLNIVGSIPMKIGNPTFISKVLRPILKRMLFLEHAVRQWIWSWMNWMPLSEKKGFTLQAAGRLLRTGSRTICSPLGSFRSA